MIKELNEPARRERILFLIRVLELSNDVLGVENRIAARAELKQLIAAEFERED